MPITLLREATGTRDVQEGGAGVVHAAAPQHSAAAGIISEYLSTGDRDGADEADGKITV